jgi:hypothetical protein
VAYVFGDSWDCYATTNDAAAGYWDVFVNAAGAALQAGRFAGSQAWRWSNTGVAGSLTKSSGVNDAVHHISVAYYQSATLTGTTPATYFQFADGATNQVCVVFRSDGTILLTSVTPAGTTLATYSGAVTATNTWFQFEFEVIISATVGRFRARKNGNTSDDFDSGASLNTRPGANSFANKLVFGASATTITSTLFDDLLWRSDAASVPWVGDIRCIARMPASDVSVQFSRTAGATNASCVDEPQQNAATDYVFDATPGHADLYTIASIASTPTSTVAVTTRAFMQKSDAGARTAAVQMKSGATTVTSNTATLASSSWGWTWRTELLDPATSTAWSAAAVNNIQVGPVTVA